MDPLGFALENFDAIGSWRDDRRARRADRRSGALPDGTKFDGPAALRDAAARAAATSSSTTLTEKLLTYALGPRRRVLRHAGRPRRSCATPRPQDYRWSASSGHRQERAVPDATPLPPFTRPTEEPR